MGEAKRRRDLGVYPEKTPKSRPQTKDEIEEARKQRRTDKAARSGFHRVVVRGKAKTRARKAGGSK